MKIKMHCLPIHPSDNSVDGRMRTIRNLLQEVAEQRVTHQRVVIVTRREPLIDTGESSDKVARVHVPGRPHDPVGTVQIFVLCVVLSLNDNPAAV